MTTRSQSIRLVFGLLAGCAFVGNAGASTEKDGPELSPLEVLGKELFHDVNLSKNRTQSCATCHDPDQGFVDPRRSADGAFSLGDDGHSLGGRNAPTAGYARFAPTFYQDENGDFFGGMFWDGRAATLEEQAGGPPLNPIEMGLSDEAELASRLRENTAYIEQFKRAFDTDVLAQDGTAFQAFTTAIAAFERTETFAPFDSKYDRFLRGEAELTDEEELGRLLFFSEQFTNCNQCHQLRASPMDRQETFTDYSYHNIGVPRNYEGIREAGGDADVIDKGLWENPSVNDGRQTGKFKTPTLRNVAVTGPYMHNGVFQDLKTVVQFYNRYNSLTPASQVNPETGKNWGQVDEPLTLAVKELTHGPALDERRIDALVAFMKTLTDARYEYLLE